MLSKNQKTRKPLCNNLCKKCKINKRVTLYFCQECREMHNKRTRELKRKYREENRCSNCGVISNTYKCRNCELKDRESKKNSLLKKSRNSKEGKYSNIMEIIKLC